MPIVVDLTGAPGTGLELSAIWLNTASDLTDVQSFEYTGDSLSANSRARAEIRQLASRRRLIRQGGTGGTADLAESMAITLVRCDQQQAAWVRAHTGVLMCVRDHIGSKFYGAWLEAPREIATAYRDRIDVKISIDQITHTEAV